jgi:hypothetical protein
MMMLRIACPSTGKPLNTGFGMDKQSYKTTELKNNTVKCPHCGQQHTWSKEDVLLEGELAN